MTKQEKSIRRYMATLAKEIVSGEDFDKAMFCINRLIQMRALLDQVEKKKGDNPEATE